LGPAGSGKSALLRAVAGLIQPHAGKIRIGNQTVFDGAARLDALVLGDPMPTSELVEDSHDWQARHDEVLTQARRLREDLDRANGLAPTVAALRGRVAELETALDEVIRTFHERGYPGYEARRSGWIAATAVDRWRTALAGQSPPGQPTGVTPSLDSLPQQDPDHVGPGAVLDPGDPVDERHSVGGEPGVDVDPHLTGHDRQPTITDDHRQPPTSAYAPEQEKPVLPVPFVHRPETTSH